LVNTRFQAGDIVIILDTVARLPGLVDDSPNL